MVGSSNWTITKDKCLTSEEVQGLYKAIQDAFDLAVLRKKNLVFVRDYFLLKTLLETGVRVAELTQLKIQDICDNSLVVQRGKGGKRRNVLISRSFQKALKDFLKIKRSILHESTAPESSLFLSERKKPFSTRGIRKRVKYWFKKCGFNSRLSVHSCRHTCISNMLAKGVDLATIRDNAGHSSLAITSIYSHVVKNDLDDLDLYSSDFNPKENYSKVSGENAQ